MYKSRCDLQIDVFTNYLKTSSKLINNNLHPQRLKILRGPILNQFE
jgi:hypothetical protein